jgi:signal transduction histidine kinase
MESDLSTIQGGSVVSCWLLSHCSLNGSAIDQSGQNHQEEAPEPGEPSVQTDLLLLWNSTTCHPCTPALERSRTLLLRLADAIGAVLSSVRLAARIEELQTPGGKTMSETDLLSPDLLAVLSHELRSPLTAIKGYASTPLRHASRLSHEERSQFLLAISEASDRLDQVVGRLLELAEFENGSITFTPVPVDPARLAQEARLFAQQRAARHLPDRFTFQVHLETAEGEEAESVPLIQADPRLLHEALDTLLDNAVKYSPEGGVITLLLRPTTDAQLASVLPTSADEPGASGARRGGLPASPGRHPPEKLLDLCVSDQGIGIPAEQVERIFARFYQVDRRLTRETSGAGLGLALCKSIVELHHGRIWVESRPGEGSTFHLVVPIPERPPQEQG